jgi:hypothetical protein
MRMGMPGMNRPLRPGLSRRRKGGKTKASPAAMTTRGQKLRRKPPKLKPNQDMIAENPTLRMPSRIKSTPNAIELFFFIFPYLLESAHI